MQEECQNYVRVLIQTQAGEGELTSSNRLLVCGTNAFNPLCRYYATNGVDEEFSGKGFCPHDPRHNSTSIFSEGNLYSGTVADFSGLDALIITKRLRTQQYDLKQLNRECP